MTRTFKTLTLMLAVLMAVFSCFFVASAEDTATEQEILQSMLVVYNMEEKVQDGVTYFPICVYAAIDKLQYKEVGMTMTVQILSTGAEKSLTQSSKKVYRSMDVTDSSGEVIRWTPDQLGGAYMFGHEMLFTAGNWVGTDTQITITPYAIDHDENTINGKTIVITDAAIKERDPDSALFKQADNFSVAVESPYLTDCGSTVTLGELFTVDADVTVDSSKVVVTVSDNIIYTQNADDWTQSTVEFTALGSGSITIKDGYNLPATLEVEVSQLEKFAKKFENTETYLYRVGNENAVALSSLFKASGIGTINSSKVTVDVEGIEGNASGTYTANASDWAKSTVKFAGTGTVNVTVNDSNNIPTTLALEVVDGYNTTGAASATTRNVVLLNDCTFSTISVVNGYTLYGNGFTMTCPNDVSYSDWGVAFVTVEDGTLDNVRIICPDFAFAGLYRNQLTSSDNYMEREDFYYNIRSAVMLDGTCKIYNSYISGGRIAAHVRSGNTTIDNSTLHGGAVANIQVGVANHVTLKDTTLIQRPIQASVHDTSKTLMGFSVLVMSDETGTTTPITLEGGFIQYAWAKEGYKNYVPSGADKILTAVLAQSDYKHKLALEGGVTEEWLNLGIAYMPAEIGYSVNTPTLNDNRTNKDTVLYEFVDLDTIGTTTKVYSYKNTNGTDSSFTVIPTYAAEENESTRLQLSYSDIGEGKELSTAYSSSKEWATTFKADLDIVGNYTFSFSNLKAYRSGAEYSYTVKDEFGNSIDTSKDIVLTDSGVYNYVISVSDDSIYSTSGEIVSCTPVIKTLHFTIIATKASINPPEKVADVGGTPLMVVKSKDSDWSCAVPALEGTQIKYYKKSAGDYTTLALNTITPTTVGKQNGTNNFWEYTDPNGDFFLRVECGTIHEGKSVYGMPVVVDNSGTKQMYFTISSTNGYVSTGTSSRSTIVTYTFTDSNGSSISFSKSWVVNYADYSSTQYLYTNFVNGELKGASSSSGGCVTPDTLITLADGTQVRVDALTGEEELLVWNMETGKLDSAPIMFVDSDPEAEVNIIELVFSDGTAVNVIYEHGFWDYDLNKYVYLDENASDYIGHTFAKQNSDALEKVQLVDVNITTESTMAYSPVTVGHLCYFVNGMLSMPGGVGGLFNIFDIDPETMTYDLEAMERDIAEYGLFTYEEMAELVPELPESMFDAAGGKYLKISIGKGNLTAEELEQMIIRYAKFF